MLKSKRLISIGFVACSWFTSAYAASDHLSGDKLTEQVSILGEQGKATATGPVSFDTADLQGLYQQLIAQNVTTLSLEKRRQLALLVLMRTAQEVPLKPDTLSAAKKLLTTILTASNDDPEVAAIAANLHALEASMAVSSMEALVITKSVTRTLDRLVLDNPNNGGVLMQRGSNALYSPTVAGRGSIAVRDFEALLSGKFAVSESARWYLLELLGLSYQKVNLKDDARRVFDELDTSHVPYWQERARTLIIRLGQ